MPDDLQPHRHTRHRDEVSALLQESNEFLSAQKVHSRLRTRGIRIGLTTVYRALQALAQQGAIDAIRTSTGEQVYRQCSPTRHHHLVCRRCARAIEVAGAAIERWAATVAARHGFRDIDHSIEIFGICGSCAAPAPPAGGTGERRACHVTDDRHVATQQ